MEERFYRRYKELIGELEKGQEIKNVDMRGKADGVIGQWRQVK